MGANTGISWANATFNPWRGCTKVSPGCANCYAETLSGRNPGTLGVWGPSGTRVVAAESAWKEPVRWNKAAACQCGGGFRGKHSMYCPQANRPRVFCASLSDMFEDWQGPMVDSQGKSLWWETDEDGNAAWGQSSGFDPQPLTMQDVRRRLFSLIDATPNLDWLLLTKRPENIERMLPRHEVVRSSVPVGFNLIDTRGYRDNLWFGTSVENQATADERIPHLLKVPAAVRFLSVEPLLGPVDLNDWFFPFGKQSPIHWVIVGGESGKGARPCRVEWVRDIVQQCKAAGVPVFVKQLGGNPVGDDRPESEVDPMTNRRRIAVMQMLTIRDRKGGDINEFPDDLRVREFPHGGK